MNYEIPSATIRVVVVDAETFISKSDLLHFLYKLEAVNNEHVFKVFTKSLIESIATSTSA